MTSSTMRIAGIVLLVVGLLAIVVAVVYFTVAADKLPSILGTLPHVTKHRGRRGVFAGVGGIVLLGAGTFLVLRARNMEY